MPPTIDPGRLDTVIECVDLDAMVEFFTQVVGLRVDRIAPADSPSTIVLSGHGASVRLHRGAIDVPGRFALAVSDDRAGTTLTAPNGTEIELVADGAGYALPDNRPSLSVVRSDDGFGAGRAGMAYRDLLPDRWGGRFIASHIRIPGGGAVADVVHFHRIRFQMIFCARGWVDLVYEDQGPPFRLEAGDCVVQPPGIRHRVLQASVGLEVIEIGCPAVHDTFVEHSIELPTAVAMPDRSFGGQHFVRDVAAGADWSPWLIDGLSVRRTGVATATDGLAGATVVRADSAPSAPSAERWLTHEGEFVFDVVLRGQAVVTVEHLGVRRAESVAEFDAIAVPPGATWQWSDWSGDFEFLEVTLPSDAVSVA